MYSRRSPRLCRLVNEIIDDYLVAGLGLSPRTVTNGRRAPIFAV